MCKTLSSFFENKGITVYTEPRLRTTAGVRKPDLVVVRDSDVWIVDTQVVSGAQSLDLAHRLKVEKYNNDPVKDQGQAYQHTGLICEGHFLHHLLARCVVRGVS